MMLLHWRRVRMPVHVLGFSPSCGHLLVAMLRLLLFDHGTLQCMCFASWGSFLLGVQFLLREGEGASCPFIVSFLGVIGCLVRCGCLGMGNWPPAGIDIASQLGETLSLGCPPYLPFCHGGHGNAALRHAMWVGLGLHLRSIPCTSSSVMFCMSCTGGCVQSSCIALV
jgi:hypothetical protein